MLDNAQDHPPEKDSLIFRAWGWWKIIWTVIRNLLYMLLILLAFDKASTAFERLVLCFLVLIYQSVTWALTTQVRLVVEEAFSNKRLLLTILKRGGEETEADEVAIREAEENYVKQNKIYYINLGGSLIVYFIVLWKVFTTLFG